MLRLLKRSKSVRDQSTREFDKLPTHKSKYLINKILDKDDDITDDITDDISDQSIDTIIFTHPSKKIGSGSYGIIYQPAIDYKHGFVTKVMSAKEGEWEFENITKFTKLIDHKNQISLPTFIINPKQVLNHIQLAVCENAGIGHRSPIIYLHIKYGGITLKDYLIKHTNGGLDILTYFKPIMENLVSMKKKEFIHRDLSNTNILIDEKTHQMTIIDFQMAVSINLLFEKKIDEKGNDINHIINTASYRYFPYDLKIGQKSSNIHTCQERIKLIEQMDYFDDRFDDIKFPDELSILNDKKQIQQSIRDSLEYDSFNIEIGQKIDTYSIGLVLFTIVESLHFEHELIKKKLYTLISHMMDPHVFRRYSPENALYEYTQILNDI
jgi:serine/threonine protein kinase